MNSRKLKKKLIGYVKFKELAKSLKASALSQIGKLKNHLTKRSITLDYFIPYYNLKDLNLQTSNTTNLLFVSFGVDKSCIGAHNINVANKLKKLYNDKNQTNINIKMYGIGKFMKYFIKTNFKNNYFGNVLNVDKEPFSLTSSIIITEKLLNINFDRYFLIFNKFIDVFKQKTCYYQIPGLSEFTKISLNLNNIINNKKLEYFLNFFYISSWKAIPEVIKEVYYFVFSMFLLDSLEENNLSGIGARISCMDNCITNAEKKIEEITLLYNKARQEEITNELVAIITAAQAIMDNEVNIKHPIFISLSLLNQEFFKKMTYLIPLRKINAFKNF